MRAWGSEGSPSARVRILSTARVRIGFLTRGNDFLAGEQTSSASHGIYCTIWRLALSLPSISLQAEMRLMFFSQSIFVSL
ncbi:hypothetical protein E2C01_040835 [Portunus trituberculatus]|uniref:Uncharacterized protein n=1 Tax=Portunus trituberculatus TaxID=210409 RepID=A0A5B7FHN9_PORTR|nr:hypothetical protein [Portunus trituberculatus]